MAPLPFRPAACAVAFSFALALSSALLATPGPPRGDAVRGGELYKAKCGACHSLDRNRIGPAHRGVVGRRAGSVPNFRYSRALRSSKIVWTPANLDRWLTAPNIMVKGTSMGFRLESLQDRADIIAYLGQNVSPR